LLATQINQTSHTMTKKYWLILPLVLLMFTCQRDTGQRLFEMVYPNTRFVIPAGLSAALPRVFEDRVSSNIEFYLSENMVDTVSIRAVNPFSATLRSLDNNDFDYIREISVRVCSDGPDPCTVADEVFYIDNIVNRAGREVRLLPTLKNARPILLEPRFKLEILFFFAFTTPYSVNSQFDMVFEVVE
jgi:hypothetical protein